MRTQWPDSFQLRSGSQKAAMHSARMSSSVWKRSKNDAAISSRRCFADCSWMRSLPGMCSDVTVTMAVKNSVEDSRTDSKLRDSWMVASNRYRDRLVLNSASISSASSTVRIPSATRSASMFFFELRRAGSPYFSRERSVLSCVTSYSEPIGAGAISCSLAWPSGLGSREFSRVVCAAVSEILVPGCDIGARSVGAAADRDSDVPAKPYVSSGGILSRDRISSTARSRRTIDGCGFLGIWVRACSTASREKWGKRINLLIVVLQTHPHPLTGNTLKTQSLASRATGVASF